MKRFRGWIAALSLLALTVVAGCGGGATGGGQRDTGAVDTAASLRAAWITPPQGVDPHLECHIGCRPYWLPVFETLYDVDPDADIVPLAAAADPTYSADGLQLTVPLRPGRTFHDGTPLDAAAAKASIERGKSLVGSTASPSLKIVSAVEVVDPLTIRLTLTQPRPNFQAILSGPAGALISPQAIASGRDIAMDPGDAGSGPYRLTSIVPNDTVVYSSVPGYWIPERGRVATLTINGIPDVNTGLNGVQGGGLDAAYGATVQAAQRSTMERAGLAIVPSDSYNMQAIYLRITRGELGNPLVRQAMASAIDRNTINDTLYEGTCEPTSQVFRAPLPSNVPDYDPYPYDLAKAKSLLAQVGLPNGVDLDIVTVAGNPTSEQNAQVVQQMLGAIGVRVTLTPMTSVDGSSAFNRDEVDARSTVVTFQSDALGSIDYQFAPGGLTHLAASGGEEITALKAQMVGADGAKVNEVLQQLGREISDQVYVLPICFQSQSWVATSKVVGLDTMGYARYGVWDPRGLAVTSG